MMKHLEETKRTKMNEKKKPTIKFVLLYLFGYIYKKNVRVYAKVKHHLKILKDFKNR